MSESMNTQFCRSMYNRIMNDVHKHVDKKLIKEAWVWKDTCAAHPSWEFQIPSVKMYWYGQASCVWDAKVEGWTSYLRKIGVEDYQ